MENVLSKIAEEIKANKKIAIAMVTKVDGSSPAVVGLTMGVYQDGSIIGSVGGGKAEARVIEKAIECIETGESRLFEFEVKQNKEDVKSCKSKIEVFINVYSMRPKLLLVGGGHVASELYTLGKYMKFSVSIFEDRKDFCNKERFPEADELILGDVATSLKNYSFDENCYVIMVSRGHKQDKDALKEVVASNANYIGMIGSKEKVSDIFTSLREEGVPEELLSKVYSPIGLAIGGTEIREIALAIMSEVVLVKNNGYSTHMKYTANPLGI